MIKRILTTKALKLLDNFPSIGILGSRQVGKTTLAKYIINNISKKAIYLDLENPKDLAKLIDPILFFEEHTDKCIVLDEIQRKPELFPILRSVIDENRVACRFIILGSASIDLIRDSSESLAGRIAYIELNPFNITEINNNKNIRDHWIYGGFPEVYLNNDVEIKYHWHQNFIRTYIERDLPMLGLNVSGNIMHRLFSMIAHFHGNVLNMSNLAKSLELSSTTIKNYLSFLENAFIIKQLKPYHTNLKKRLVKSPKLYIRDTGQLHYLLDIFNFDSLLGNPIIGTSWEGYVIEQITQILDKRITAFYYRTHQGAECDLVLVKANLPYIGIEIKYTSAPKLTKSLINSIDDLQLKTNFIITPKSDNYLIRKDIRVCSLLTFMKNYLPQINQLI